MAAKKERATVKSAATKAKPAAIAAPAARLAVTASVVAVAPAPVRDRSTIVGLIARLRDPDAETARDAAETLGRLPADDEAVGALCAAVRNADGFFHPVVRTAAAATLGLLGDRRAVEALIAGTSDTMAEASEEAIKALGLLGDARAVAALEAAIRNDNGFFLEHVRTAARDALGKIQR